MTILFEPPAYQHLITLANEATRRRTEMHAYLLGHRRNGQITISTVLRPGNPVECTGMAQPDFGAAGLAIRPYLDRGELLVGEAHRHDTLIGPSAGDRNMLLKIPAEQFPHYLCVVITTFDDDRSPVITAHSVANSEIVEHEVGIAPDYSGLLPETVAQESILQVGVGSGGSLSLLQIAKLGVQRLTIVDPDRFSRQNFARHLAPRGTRGNKAIWAGRFLRKRTNANLVAIPMEVTPDNRDDLRALVREHTLVINSTGHPLASILISEACTAEQRPCIHAGAFARGKGGFVFLQIPNGPCYECLYQLNLQTITDDTVTMELLQRHYGYTPKELEAQIGLWTDINMIAAVQTKVLTEYLKHGAHQATPNFYLIDNTNMAIIKRRVQPKAGCACQKGATA